MNAYVEGHRDIWENKDDTREYGGYVEGQGGYMGVQRR